MYYNLRRGTKDLIKDLNRALVIEEVRRQGPISRTDAARNTNLGLSTITKIVDDLIAQNLLVEVGEGASNGGRKPINLLFNNDYGYVIGIKIEEKQVILGLTNLAPMLHEKKTYQYKLNTKVEEVLAYIDMGIQELQEAIRERNGRLLGIGIAVSGVINQQMGALRYSSLLGWENVEFKRLLEDRYHVPIYVDNDVNCYVIAEKWLGKGMKWKNFALVSIGKGIGAGFVIDEKIYRGKFGGAGEIGHSIIKAGGRKCYCGQQGCLEAYAGEDYILDYVKKNAESDQDSYLSKDDLNISEVILAARNGNSVALDAFKKAGEYIGYGLINIIMFFNPEAIILAGEGLEEQEFIVPYIKKQVQQNWINKDESYDTPIVISLLDPQSFILGAAILVIADLLSAPIYNDSRILIE